MRGTRKKMRAREKPSIRHYMQEFSVGDNVHIKISSSSNFPHPKFHGRTGKIIEKRGRSYVVGVSDMNAQKKVSLRPEHLRKVLK